MKPLLLLLAVTTLELAWAQTPQRRPNTYHASGGAANARRWISPEVRADRTITFRVLASKAREVSLSFLGKSQAMAQLDDGTWSITAGPVEPEIYEYSFTIDGARVLDMSNTAIKTGRTLTANFVEVPGSPPGLTKCRTCRTAPSRSARTGRRRYRRCAGYNLHAAAIRQRARKAIPGPLFASRQRR